jgi:hypothetical protein
MILSSFWMGEATLLVAVTTDTAGQEGKGKEGKGRERRKIQDNSKENNPVPNDRSSSESRRRVLVGGG